MARLRGGLATFSAALALTFGASLGWGQDDPRPQGPEPAPQGPEPAPQGLEPAPQGPEPAPQGPEPAPQGPEPDPRPQGPQPAPQGPQPAPQGPEPDPRPQGPQPAPSPRAPRPRSEPLPPPKSAPEIRGVAFPLHSRDPRYDYRPQLVDLPPLGIRQVLVVVHLYQPRGVSPFPARHPLKTPRDEVVRGVIEAARELGLEVGLMPIVLLDTPHEGEWRGNLTPPDKQGRTRGQEGFDERQADWERWFRGYGREVRHYARLAQRAGASLFSVGSELSSTEGQRERWTSLIREVRGLFAGELTYSANWDHYEHVEVWEQLDYVGLSGYYELVPRKNKNPTVRELIKGWGRWRDKILRWHRRAGLSEHPLLFTEVGYASIDGCAAKPWNYTLDTKLDLREQRDCYQAFAHTWGGQEALGGVFFYEWWGYGGHADRGYTPRGKPALDVLKRWFRAD